MTRTVRFPMALLFLLLLVLTAPALAQAPEAEKPPEDDEFALLESARLMRDSGNVQFNFQDVEMVKFVRFMSELLQENLVMTPDVKGSISVISPKPVPIRDARQVLLSVLEMNGYTLQKVGAFSKIVPFDPGASAESDVRSGRSGPGEGAQTVSQVVPLNYVTADSILQAVIQASEDGDGAVGGSRKRHTLTGRATADVNRALSVIRALDRPDRIVN